MVAACVQTEEGDQHDGTHLVPALHIQQHQKQQAHAAQEDLGRTGVHNSRGIAWEIPTKGCGEEANAAAQPLYSAAVPAGGSSKDHGSVLTAEAVASIKAGRKRFLKYQQRLDGDLVVAAVGAGGGRSSERLLLQPTQVVEAVADLLLEDMVKEQVQELDGWCNHICEQLFDAEFADA